MKALMFFVAPLLIWQGRRVRKTTLRLPEAAGARSGVAGEHRASIRLLVLGDSAAAGVGCMAQSDAVCGQLVAGLATNFRVHWRLWAQSSLTCAGIHELAKQQPACQPFDVVLVSAGVNDVTRRTPREQWREDLVALTDYLRNVRGAKRIIYTAIPPMHKFPALPQPLRWFIGQQAKLLNADLQQHCAANDCGYLAFDFPFEPDYMARDGFHPSPKAAKLWAKETLFFIQQKKSPN